MVFLSSCSGWGTSISDTGHQGSGPFQRPVGRCLVLLSTFYAMSYLLTLLVKSHEISRPSVPGASRVLPLRTPKARSGVGVEKRCLNWNVGRLLPRTVSLRICFRDCIASTHVLWPAPSAVLFSSPPTSLLPPPKHQAGSERVGIEFPLGEAASAE